MSFDKFMSRNPQWYYALSSYALHRDDPAVAHKCTSSRNRVAAVQVASGCCCPVDQIQINLSSSLPAAPALQQRPRGEHATTARR